MSQPTYSSAYALNTVAASGADASLDAGILSLTGGFTFPYNNIDIGSVKITAAVTGVARVTTLTFTAPSAVGEQYEIFLSQFEGNGAVANQSIYLTSVVGSTAASMATQAESALSALISGGLIEGTVSRSSAVVTLNGTVGSPMLRVVGSSSNIALSATTAGTVPVNNNTQLSTLDAKNYVSTNTYTVLQFNYQTDVNTINSDESTSTFYYLINEGDADAADLVTKLTEIFQGIIPGGTAANPEAIAKI
jgi:hypothetical protein